MHQRRTVAKWLGPKLTPFAASAVGIFAAIALSAACCACSGCTREADQAGSAAEPAAGLTDDRPADDSLAPARAAIDKVAVKLEALAQAAELAHGDRQLLVPIDREFQADLAAAKASLAPFAKRGSDDNQRALQRYYGLRIGPALSRLQVLVFPARMAALPAGATPTSLPAPASGT